MGPGADLRSHSSRTGSQEQTRRFVLPLVGGDIDADMMSDTSDEGLDDEGDIDAIAEILDENNAVLDAVVDAEVLDDDDVSSTADTIIVSPEPEVVDSSPVVDPQDISVFELVQ